MEGHSQEVEGVGEGHLQVGVEEEEVGQGKKVGVEVEAELELLQAMEGLEEEGLPGHQQLYFELDLHRKQKHQAPENKLNKPAFT